MPGGGISGAGLGGGAGIIAALLRDAHNSISRGSAEVEDMALDIAAGAIGTQAALAGFGAIDVAIRTTICE